MDIGDYLIQQIKAHGADHVFGIPGDFVLKFYDKLSKSQLKVINTSDEQGAGFAADAYARIRGFGVVCVTYSVGGLKVANTTAQAYAEKSPVLVISGSPGLKERIKNPLLHHKVRDFDTQYKIFKELTIASTVLDNPETACQEIDRVISTIMRYKRPGYIEIPRDMVSVEAVPHHVSEVREQSAPDVLEEALEEAVSMINSAKKPVIIVGIEVQRFQAHDLLLQFIKKTNIPYVETILSKSTIGECHPAYMGIYEGAMGNEAVTEYVESSDCLLLIGTFMTDLSLGMFTAKLDHEKSIYITSEKFSIRRHSYENVKPRDFLTGLNKADIKRRKPGDIPHPPHLEHFSPVKGQKITVKRLFDKLNSFIKKDLIVIADVGDALFASVDLSTRSGVKFIAAAYYASLGFSVPGAIGIQMANPELRPLVLVGDGAFQMTGMELAMAVHYRLNPIVVIYNNYGYGTERPMLDGPYNDVYPWKFTCLPEVIGGGKGFTAETEDQLDEALHGAVEYKEGFSIVEVRLDPNDHSEALKRLTSRLAKLVAHK